MFYTVNVSKPKASMNGILVLEVKKTVDGFIIPKHNSYVIADFSGDIKDTINRGDYVIIAGNDFIYDYILIYMIEDIIKYNGKIVALGKQESLYIKTWYNEQGTWYNELPQLTTAVNKALKLAGIKLV